MISVAKQLMQETRQRRPDLYQAILVKIQPYSLESVLEIFEQHLQHVSDIRIFETHREVVPEFVHTVIMHMKFPETGDAFGINVICRVTKSDTQGTLDSKHLQTSIPNSQQHELNVEKEVLNELALFSNHMQLFQLANRHKFATIFMSHEITLESLLYRLPKAGILDRGRELNRARNVLGSYAYLTAFRYLLVEDRGSVKILYRNLMDLYQVLKYLHLQEVVAFSDIRCLFKRCGSTITFFNMIAVAQRQLFANDDSRYEKDVTTLLSFMFCRSEFLPMNRDGLARNKDRSPLDVLSFEAMKRNASRQITGKERNKWNQVLTSNDKCFAGIQFNEGTGGPFALLGDTHKN